MFSLHNGRITLIFENILSIQVRNLLILCTFALACVNQTYSSWSSLIQLLLAKNLASYWPNWPN